MQYAISYITVRVVKRGSQMRALKHPATKSDLFSEYGSDLKHIFKKIGGRVPLYPYVLDFQVFAIAALP